MPLWKRIKPNEYEPELKPFMKIFENGRRASRKKNNPTRNFGAKLENDMNVDFNWDGIEEDKHND